MKRRILAIAVFGIAVAGWSAAVEVGSNSAATSRPPLFKDSRQSIAVARAQGRDHVVVLLVAEEGLADALADAATRLGGDIRYRDDDAGYLRVRVPIDRASELADPKRLGVPVTATAATAHWR